MKTVNKSKFYALFAVLVLPGLTIAQETTTAAAPSAFSNALFNTLLVTSLVLLAVIIALAAVLKNIAASDRLIRNTKNANKATKATLVAFLVGGASQMHAAATVVNDSIGGMNQFTFYFMVVIVGIEALVLGLLILTMNKLLREELAHEASEAAAAGKQVSTAPSILDKFNASVAVEQESEIMLDHDYDGIKELDNDLPPWWKYGFYLTILVAVIYLTNYHITGTGDLQTAEYKKEMKAAELAVAEFMKNSANMVDENTVKMLEKADIEAGGQIFLTSCAACHGRAGEGGVGPNLTDNYWVHGGKLADIFKSIKYGWIEKGMKSWKEDFSPMQIAQLTSYIKSITGTNPANAKAPQGDLFTEESSLPTDSTAVKKDTLQNTLDTLKAANPAIALTK